MALSYLYKSDTVKRNEKRVLLTYKDIDPVHQQKLVVSEREAEAILEHARGEAERMLAKAKRESEHLWQTSHHLIERERQSAKDAMQKERLQFEKTKEEAAADIEKAKEFCKGELDKRREELEKEFEVRGAELEKSMYEKVYEEAKEQGVRESLTECERLIGRVQVILDEAIRHRMEILAEVENHITDLVLLIAKKVVKSLSSLNHDVVVKNVVEALKNLKGREHFIIRVNTKDLQNVKQHISSIQEMLESKRTITFAEDSKVDPGGCIIETDFGEVDARIATQMQKIEQSIREAIPIRHV